MMGFYWLIIGKMIMENDSILMNLDLCWRTVLLMVVIMLMKMMKC